MSDTRILRGRGVVLTVLVGALLGLTGCGTAASSTTDIAPPAAVDRSDGLRIDGELVADRELYEAARGGSVTLYTSGSQQSETAISERFTEETGIPLTFTRLATAKMTERVQSLAGADRLDADVIRTADPAFADRLARSGVLVPYDPPSVDALVAAGAMQAGRPVISCYSMAYAFAYNNRVVPPQQAPRRWADLLDPRWGDGRLGTARPTGAGSAPTDFVNRHFGPQYWQRMAANGVRVFDAGVAVQADALARGEIAVGTFPADVAFAAGRAGAPITFVVPEDPDAKLSLAVLSLGMTPVGLENPAARVFVNWSMSKAAQRFAAAQAYVPARTDLGPLPDVPFGLPQLGTPGVEPFTLADQLARKDEALAIWNAAFRFRPGS
ncbi:ABC transporter substrate-binding protein [Pseudonocardia sp. DR1-2]|uniref:ABC transporter substrate-binding protein n=1 Tax=Pseudonocardia sp. DR1-2 TaxID=2951168 RepID=UPI002042FE73|nr:ABC transporter substrate-binding protein [Pseudonocardia sp. DR1-2]MCM3850026.1 ABC transporter substrate-binding protein [Pseudonocardia sp. DR1-2]